MFSFLTQQEWWRRAISQFSNAVPVDVAPEFDAGVDPTHMLMYCGAVARMDALIAVHRNLRDELVSAHDPRALDLLPVLERMQRVVDAFQDLGRYADAAALGLPHEIAERYAPPDIVLTMLPREQELMRELSDEAYRRTRPPRDECE